MRKTKFTKLLCLVLSLVMILGAAPITGLTAFAADPAVIEGFAGGNGSAENPYQIATLAELKIMADFVNGGNACTDTYFVLTADIGTAEEPVTTVIADNYWNFFRGYFDGQNHTVTLNINRSGDEDYSGLFGKCEEGTILNVNTAGSVAATTAGGICGVLRYGRIENCHNSATITIPGEVRMAMEATLGGVCGYSEGGTILNCSNSGEVSCVTSETEMCYIGGVCGNSEYGNYEGSKLLNCSNSGAVSCNSDPSRPSYRDMRCLMVGGVCGLISGTMANCYNSGAVSSDRSAEDYEGVGSVYGYAFSSVLNCYYDKDVCPNEGVRSSDDLVPATGLTAEQCKAARGTDGALVDLLNGYIKNNPDSTANWNKWSNKAGSYPEFAAPFIYTAEDNVLTATSGDTVYTLTLTDNGTLSDEELAAWEAAGLTVPEIVFDAETNTASITVEDATATAALAEGTLKTHTVKVICGADSNGNSYIADALTGTDITVTAGTYEGKLFEKWISDLSVDGSTDETVTFRMPDRDVTLEAEFVDCYPLSVFDGTTLTSEPQKVDYSVTVTVPDAPEGMGFKNWTAEGITLDDATASTLTFNMPANAVMLTANFAALYTVSAAGGKITNAGTSATAFAGDTVSVTADADNNDSRFTQWSSEADITFADKTAKTTTFTMPDADVIVTAEREQSYTVTVTDGTASGLNGAGKAFAGDTITVTAGTFSGHNFTGWTGEGVEFDNAANTTTTFTMPEGNVTVKANHEAIKVAIPTAGTKTYTYSGDYQGYEFANEGDKSYYTLSGNVQINAGTYTVKAHLTVDGTVWTDGTTADKEYTFVINRQPVDKPIAYNTQYYYTGAEQSFILCRQVNGSYYYYETTIPSGSVYIRGNTRTDAGSQAVTVTPADNYCWQDGTTGTLYFSFTINRYPIPTLFDDPRSFTYNGNAQTYTPFVMRNGKLYDFDGLYYDLSNRTQTAAGSYTVTATLRNNFCWYDGSTAPRNFSFNIRMKELDSFIYYVNDLKTGENEVCVDMTYTSYDKTNTLKGFESRPGFKPEMLKDRYQPCLMNVPAGADVMFYLKETPGTPKNISEVSKCKRWNDVKMSDLQPNTIYYMFAVVTHPDYPGFQITEVNNMSRFITSVPQFTLINCKRVKETEVNQHYKFECAMAMVTGNVNAMLGAFGNKSTSKYVNVTTKVANYTNIEDALAQAIKDIEGGLDGALIGWYDEHGVMQSFSVFHSNLDNARKALANLTKKSVVRSAPKNMLAAPAGDPAPVEITGISGEVPELTDELLNSMFTPEELSVLPLDTAAFKMEMELETGAEQIEAEKEALIARLAANDIATEEDAEGFFYTATVGNILYDPATGLADGESNDYELAAGEKLPADAVKEIEGYTFIGLYYAEIMGFEKEAKSEDATGDHGMILTQGLVKWDPETDVVTRDLDLMALYVKDGAEEPVSYKADGTTFLDEGSEAVITLPALMDGMTYGDVINDNADINVSAINDGKVTVTLANDVTGEEPFTFTVGVNANKEGIEDPFYYIVVTINAVEASDIKEDTETAIEALADDTASDEVKAIIAEAVAALADANSIEAVNEILAKAEAAVALQKAKEEAKAAIDAAIEADDSDDVKAAAEEAKAAIDNADSVEEIEAVKTSGLDKMEDVRGRCPYCGRKGHENIFAAFFCLLVRFLRMLTMFFTGGRSIIGSL